MKICLLPTLNRIGVAILMAFTLTDNLLADSWAAPAATLTDTVSPASGTGSLRQTILSGTSGDAFTFAPNLSGSTIHIALAGAGFSTAVVTTANDSGLCSLRQVIAEIPAGTIITFDPSLSGAPSRSPGANCC